MEGKLLCVSVCTGTIVLKLSKCLCHVYMQIIHAMPLFLQCVSFTSSMSWLVSEESWLSCHHLAGV